MISFHGSSDEFSRKARALADEVERVALDAVEEASREHVKGMDKATPPRNRQAGEGKIAKDILQVLRGVPGPGDATPSAAHKSARNSSGQTRKRREKVRVNNARLQRYLKSQTRKAGKLKSALNTAKRALGLNVPGWLSRHGDNRGDFTIERDSRGVVARIINKVPYASNVRTLVSSLADSRNKAASHLRKKTKDGVTQAKRKAGF